MVSSVLGSSGRYRGVHSAAVDPFVVIMVGGTLGLVVALLLLGRFYPGSGTEVIDWQPTRSPELEAQNEIDDLEQLREVVNRRRRRKGLPELTEDNLHAELVDRPDAPTESAAELDADVAELLELSNARRRRKGLPEVTLEEFKAELEG
jgi:hypothetical protein